MGMPLTVAQYYELTPDRIIERLINRHKHLLATEICFSFSTLNNFFFINQPSFLLVIF